VTVRYFYAFPALVRTTGSHALYMPENGSSICKNICSFRGCFTQFPGVFRAFSGRVLLSFRGCFTQFPGVFRAFSGRVSLFFRACFTQFPGVFRAVPRGVSCCSPGCFVPVTGGETPRFLVRNVPAIGVDCANSRGVARRRGESRNGVNSTPESGT
jgi:hypothetical protein